MIKMKYCCDGFESRATLPRGKALNVRIMNLKKDQLLLVDNRFPIKCFIAPAYVLGDKTVPFMPIFFCPFCGKNLLKFYQDENYINEDSEVLRL